MTWIKEYCVIGKNISDSRIQESEIFLMKIFAQSDLNARSRYWYHLNTFQKKKNIHIILTKKVSGKKSKNIKNYGIWIKCKLRLRVVNMYKEFKDVLGCGAVEQLYTEMSSKHKILWSSMIILRIEELEQKECICDLLKQFHSSHVKFPVVYTQYKNNSNLCFYFKKDSFIVTRN